MKKFIVFLLVVGVANIFISISSPNSQSATPFTVVEREPVVLDMPTAKDGEYETPAEPVYYEPETKPYAWSDDHDTAPVPEFEFDENDFLGDWITADGRSDIRFYMYNGQLYYAAYYDGVYYEGHAYAYPTHGAIYCMDGYITDGNIAISFYYGYDHSGVMYDQVTGTEYYLKTSY